MSLDTSAPEYRTACRIASSVHAHMHICPSLHIVNANPSLPNSCCEKEGVVLVSLRALPSRTEMSRWLYYSSYFLPSFLPRGLPCPASRRRLTSPPPPESALSLSPSFQVIDVLSLRRIHQHGGILGRGKSGGTCEQLCSFFLSGVADVLSSPPPCFLPSGLRSHLQILRGPRPTWFP